MATSTSGWGTKRPHLSSPAQQQQQQQPKRIYFIPDEDGDDDFNMAAASQSSSLPVEDDEDEVQIIEEEEEEDKPYTSSKKKKKIKDVPNAQSAVTSTKSGSSQKDTKVDTVQSPEKHNSRSSSSQLTNMQTTSSKSTNRQQQQQERSSTPVTPASTSVSKPTGSRKEEASSSSAKTQKERSKKWIEATDDGYFRLLIGKNKSMAPIVHDLTDARNVIEWFRQEGFVGVKRRSEKHGGGYAAFVIVDGTVQWLEDAVFETPEDAARAHDDQLKALDLRYIKNFAAVRKAPEQVEVRVHNRSAETKYRIWNTRVHFIRNNVRMTKLLAIRLCANPLVESVEIWRCLRALVKLCSFWSIGPVTSVKIIRDFSEALKVAWKLGDRRLCIDADMAKVVKKSDNEEVMDERIRRNSLIPRKLLKDRLKWNEGILGMFKRMYTELKKRKYPRIAARTLDWGADILRQLSCLLVEQDDAEQLERFVERLEEMELQTMWKNHSDFLQLRGEILLLLTNYLHHLNSSSSTDAQRYRQAQRYFTRALKADPHNSRAKAFLAASEHLVFDAEQNAMNTTMVSISQRTTQESQQLVHDDEDEEETGTAFSAKADKPIPVTKLITDLVRDDRHDISAWLAMENLLFVDDAAAARDGQPEPYSQLSEEILENKRQCLLSLLDVEPTLSGGAIDRIVLLWRLTRRTRDHEKRIEFFWSVANVMEHLTQKECPNFVHYFSPKSVMLWEYLVTCLNALPQGAIRFEAQRADLWRRRFFPDTLGYFDDPLGFYLDRGELIAAKNGETLRQRNHRPDQYLFGLKALVASITDLSEPFHVQAYKLLGKKFVHTLCVKLARENCAAKCGDPVPKKRVKYQPAQSTSVRNGDDGETITPDAGESADEENEGPEDDDVLDGAQTLDGNGSFSGSAEQRRFIYDED